MTRKCSISGWTDVETHEHHIGARVNTPTTVALVRPDLHYDLQRALEDAGVVHDHDHAPSSNERLWAVCKGLAEVCSIVLSRRDGIPGLAELAQTVVVGLGGVMAESDPSELGPDPMESEAWRARRERSKSRRPPRFCWGCGLRLGGRRRKWCASCVVSPDKRSCGYDRVAANAQAALAPADRLGLVVGVGSGLSIDLAGVVEEWVLAWLAGLGELAEPLGRAWGLLDDYARAAELADATEGVLPVLATYAEELVNSTAVRTPSVAEVLRHIDAVLRADDLMGLAVSMLEQLSACETGTQAHVVLDEFTDHLATYR
jgi:hypothetical protein